MTNKYSMRHHSLVLILLLLLCLLAAPTAAGNITNSAVSDTNIYAGSNEFNIGTAAEIDSTSSADSITNIAGRYLYASGLSAAVDGDTATFSLITRQGSTTINATLGTVQGYLWEYGDGTTGTADTHTYEIGIYTANLTISNELTESPITLSTRLQIGETTINVSLSAAEIGTGGSWTLNAQTQNAETVQWQVKTPGSTTWQNISGTTYTPTTYGNYQFRAIANGLNTQIISDTLSGTYEASIQGCTVENTNIYANSNVFDIGPANSYTDSTASGITNVAGRYLYASALTAAVDGPSAVYTISGLQGSTTVEAEQGTAQGYLWEYGDGTTGNTNSLEHLYRESGTYQTNLTLTNYLDSTGVTLQANTLVFGPYIGNFEVDKTAGGVHTTFNFSVITLDTTSIDWFYSKSSTGQWIVISGEHSDTLSYTPGKTGYWYIRAKATNSTTGFSAYTEPITITVWPSPTISQTSITPNQGSLTQTVTLSASVVDNAGGTTYQWQTSSDGSTWSNISGATTATWVGTLNLQQAGKYLYRLIASGIGGTTTSNIIAYQAYAPPVFAKLESSASIVALPASVTLTAYASDTNTYTWQELRNGQWVNIGSGGKIYQQITSAGNHTYRVIASGFGGTTTSQTLTVDAGYLPSVVINSPENGFKVKQNETITVIATVQNADSYTWNFGNNEHYETISGTTAEVRYPKSSSNVVSITAVNKYGSVTKSITIIVMYDFNRPTVNTTIDRLDTSDLTDWMDSLNPDHDSQMPDIMGIFGKMLSPYTQAIGSWMYLILFAVPYLIIWIRQKNTIIPSILGVLFGVWILVQFPTSAVLPAAGILVLSISGGVYGIYVKFQR